ncbi:MAG: tellurite resistance TerB family protein [Myxococcaceae bacterium]
MPRNALAQTRADRNAALLDAMVLAASADGKIEAIELQQLLTRIIERPEFDGVDAAELSGMVEHSVRRLSQARTLDDILHVLKERLGDHRSRLLAFGLATSIALADERATREELGVLKSLQRALGLTEDEVSRTFEQVQSGASLADVLGEPLEQLYAETMVLVSAADGQVKEHELQSMLENLAGDPVFKEVSLESAQKYLRDAVENLTSEGLPSRLSALAQGLSTHAQRSRAFRLAVRVAYSDGKPSPAELRVLDLLQATFGLADHEVARITVES